MYSTETETQNYSDAKYAVADILSAMANGQGVPVTTSSYVDSATNYVTGISTGTTPTLTPTTLASIEQAFIELDSSNQGITTTVTSTTGTTLDLSRQSGFVPPVVEPVKSEYHMSPYGSYQDGGDSSESDPDWMPSGPKRSRMESVIQPNRSYVMQTAQGVVSSTTKGPARKTGGRKPKSLEHTTPEEEEKRRLRRERNKLAAAKCRQRRVDHTNVLINETETLEEEKASLEDEIQSLQQQKEQLEFLLEAHKPMCNNKHACLKLASVATTDSSSIRAGEVLVKTEPSEDSLSSVSSGDSRLGVVTTNPSVTVYAVSSPLAAATGAGSSRPSTLPIRTFPQNLSATASVTEATGIAITTPSKGVFSTLGLDSMVDGHTGLTPLTGVPSCASEVHKNSSDSSSPSESLSSPQLMAL